MNDRCFDTYMYVHIHIVHCSASIGPSNANSIPRDVSEGSGKKSTRVLSSRKRNAAAEKVRLTDGNRVRRERNQDVRDSSKQCSGE